MKALLRHHAWLVIIISIFIIVSYSTSFAYPLSTTSDTATFEAIANHSILSSDFLGGTRPVVVPLLFKLFSNNHAQITTFFLIFSICSWSLLAFSLSHIFFNTSIKVLMGIGVMLFSFSDQLFLWHKMLLSESIAISSFVLFLACAILFTHYLEAYKAENRSLNSMMTLGLCVVGSAAIWSFSRDTNSYVLLGIALAIIAYVLVSKYRQTTNKATAIIQSSIAGVFIIFFILNSISANHGQRWIFPIVNVISQRILTNPDAVDYFIAHGMPNNSSVHRFAGAWASSHDWDWTGFGKWLYKDSKKVYISYLLSHPVFAFSTLVKHYPYIFGADFSVDAGDIKDGALLWQNPLSRLTWPRNPTLALQTLAALLAALWFMAKRKLFLIFGFLLFIFSLTIANAFMCFHGDAMEVPRHCLPASLQLRLSTWLILLLSLGVTLLEFTRIKEHNRSLP